MRVLPFLFISLLILNTCANEPIIDEKPKEEKKWELIPEFAEINIRYIVNNQNSLYIAGVKYLNNGKKNGTIYTTTDGSTWQLIGEFPDEIGPMTYNNGLFILRQDSIYKYVGDKKWIGVLPTPRRMMEPYADGDMIFIDDNLYIMQTFYPNTRETYKVYPDGTSEEVKVLFGMTFGAAKFIKNNFSNQVYVRGNWGVRGVFKFDGSTFIPIENGLSEKELLMGNPTNSMTIKDNKLIAGFNPAVIKRLTDAEIWENITDTMQYSTNNIYDDCWTTAITYLGDRLFAATNYYGVFEWTTDSTWKDYSRGLLEYDFRSERPDKYYPITFLECFKGKVYAGYGSPAYAPWNDGESLIGLYINKF